MKKLINGLIIGTVLVTNSVLAETPLCLDNGLAKIPVSITGDRRHNPTVVGYGKSTVLTPGNYRLTYTALNGRDIRPLVLDRPMVFTNNGFKKDLRYTLSFPVEGKK